jgi:hypothetical protein
MKIDRRYPVVPVRLELSTKLAYLAPAFKIVVRVVALFKRDNFGKLATKQGKCTPRPDYTNRHIMLVEDKHIAVKSGL